jgi:hypothetical protein
MAHRLKLKAPRAVARRSDTETLATAGVAHSRKATTQRTPRNVDRAIMHIDCLIDLHPELANALDHARRHGEWIADI